MIHYENWYLPKESRFGQVLNDNNLLGDYNKELTEIVKYSTRYGYVQGFIKGSMKTIGLVCVIILGQKIGKIIYNKKNKKDSIIIEEVKDEA